MIWGRAQITLDQQLQLFGKDVKSELQYAVWGHEIAFRMESGFSVLETSFGNKVWKNVKSELYMPFVDSLHR